MLIPSVRYEKRMLQDFGIGAGMALAGAATAASTAYSANQANSASAGNAYMSNMTNMVMQAQNQDYNSAEAAKVREFNAAEALKNRGFQSYEAAAARESQSWEARANRDWQTSDREAAQGFNADEATKNRDFQERMSNTQYQRATSDMKAAGLNPMLAYSQGGAGNVSGTAASIARGGGSQAGGGQASGSQASGGQASSGGWAGAKMADVRPVDYGQMITGAVDLAQKVANVEQTNAQTKLLGGQSTLVGQQARKIDDEIKLLVNQTQESMHRATNETEKTGLIRIEKELKAIEGQLASQKITESEAYTRVLKVREQAERYGLEGLKNTEEFERGLGNIPGGGGSSAKMLIEILKMFKGR